MKKAAFTLILITILSKIIGFGKEIVLSSLYGTTYVSDAYLISLAIPGFVLTFLGAAITTTYMPTFSDIENKLGEKESYGFTNKLINLLLIVSILIILIVLLFTETIVKIFASGFTGETLLLAVQLTRISIFSIIFFGIVYVLNGYLQLKRNFLIPTFAGIPLNIILMISIFLSSIYGELVLAYGKIAAVLAQLLILIIFACKKGYRYSLESNFFDKKILNMIYLAIPVLLGTSVNQINRIIDRTIASNIVVGGVSALNYAERVNIFVQSIFVVSIATVMYANITHMVVKNEKEGLVKTLKEAIVAILIFTLPATIGIIVFAYPIVNILFGRGAFDINSVNITAKALFFYSIGIVAIGIREILVRVFYSLKDTKKPVINATIGMFINIILNIILSKYLGVGGLALATSISAIITSILMLFSLRKKIGPFGMKQISISFLKILFASSIMGLFAKLSFNYLTVSLSQNLSLLLAIGVGAVSYFVIIYFMKIEDVDVIVGAIKKKFGRGTA